MSKNIKPKEIGSKYIEITISEDGDSTKIEAHGFEGTSCQEATRSLEQALGGVTQRTVKQTRKQDVKARVKG